MKKYLCSLFFFIISLSVVYGCEKQVLPMPVYPLDAATVTEALKEAELSWMITEEEPWPEGQIVYTLHDEDDKLVAFILSGILNERRLLDVSFMPYSDNPTITQFMPEEEWEKAIIFATLLYGGFESKHQVYDCFTNDHGEKNTVTVPREKIVGNGEVSTWQSEINGIYCLVRIECPYVSMPQRYLNTIRFDNTDGDAFNFEGVTSGTYN